MTNNTPRDSWKKTFFEIVLPSIAMLVLLAIIVGGAFMGFDSLLKDYEFTVSRWVSFGCWYALGFVCALFWPLRYFRGMRGHWPQAVPQLFILALTGPFALLLGFPL